MKTLPKCVRSLWLIYGAARGLRKPEGFYYGGFDARGSAGSYFAVRAAGVGQNDAGADCGARTGRRVQGDVRSDDFQSRRSGGYFDESGKNDVLFIDEIHRLNPAIEEVLYAAMEDFQLDLIIGEGPAARSVRIDLQPFTLIGATTRSGLLTQPLRDRFGIPLRLDFYDPADLEKLLSAERAC